MLFFEPDRSYLLAIKQDDIPPVKVGKSATFPIEGMGIKPGHILAGKNVLPPSFVLWKVLQCEWSKRYFHDQMSNCSYPLEAAGLLGSNLFHPNIHLFRATFQL